MTPAHLRPLAEHDLVEQTRHYRQRGGDELGARFFDAAIAALEAISRRPGAGSARLAELCDIPELRFRRIPGFPCGWCNFVTDHHVDVVRLVGDGQNLPAVLADLVDE